MIIAPITYYAEELLLFFVYYLFLSRLFYHLVYFAIRLCFASCHRHFRTWLFLSVLSLSILLPWARLWFVCIFVARCCLAQAAILKSQSIARCHLSLRCSLLSRVYSVCLVRRPELLPFHSRLLSVVFYIVSNSTLVSVPLYLVFLDMSCT